VIHVADENAATWIRRADAYQTAVAFSRGDFDVSGDFLAAVRWKTAVPSHGIGGLARGIALRLATLGFERWFQTRRRAAKNIRYHYDASNAFYELFLDSRLVYSCAYFKNPAWSIDEAQEAKLEYICRKLDVKSGDRFLDIGCGWGALVLHAGRHGATATGCTLSRNQFDGAKQRIKENGLAGRVTVLETDYRNLKGSYDKIASVGMFEHVGRKRLGEYFRKCHALLAPNGLFLNHGIIRPQLVKETAETVFWTRQVFPGAQIVHLSDVIVEAEKAGFEVLDVENLRPHYALTCRAWVERLRQNESECVRLASREKYRSWLLLLAAAAFTFEDGQTDLCQVLLAKRLHPHGRRMNRDHMRV
jgi:cyclopropane-fatty-acyl-phospholipid synthase